MILLLIILFFDIDMICKVGVIAWIAKKEIVFPKKATFCKHCNEEATE